MYNVCVSNLEEALDGIMQVHMMTPYLFFSFFEHDTKVGMC